MNWVYKLNRLSSHQYKKKISHQVVHHKKVIAPQYVLWDCTRRCNLHCEHCGATKECYTTELSKNEIKKTIEDLAAMKTRMFAVTGGEPFLRNDLLEILSFASSQGLKTGIATNGFFIDKKMAENIRKIGVYSIQVSIDGMEQTHNKIRGNLQSFQKAVDAIKNLQNINMPVLSVATTITTSNIGDIEQMKDFFNGLHIKTWRISIIMPIGRAEQPTPLLLNKTQMKTLLSFVKHHQKPVAIQIAENLPFLGSFEEQIRQEPILCPVGITACCIGVDGNVRGCAEQPDIPEFIEGNVKHDSIIDIWQKGFKKYRLNETMLQDKRCSQCDERYHCFGGCHVMRLGNTHCIYDLLV